MATTWATLGSGPRSIRATQAVPTESAPTLPTEGVWLNGVEVIRLIVHAPPGQTFDGLGWLLAWVLPAYDGSSWVRVPRLDLDMIRVEGLADAELVVVPVIAKAGRFAAIPSSVGVSGGTQMTSEYVCVSPNGNVL